MSDKKSFAAAPGGKREEFVVESNIVCCLTCPPSPQRSDCLKKFFCVVPVGSDIIVPENERPSRHAADLVDDFADRSVAHPSTVHRRNRTIVAREWTAARGNGNSFSIHPSFDQIPSWRRRSFQVRKTVVAIQPFKPSILAIAENARPDKFSFADNNCIRVQCHLVRHQRCMWSPDDNRNT